MPGEGIAARVLVTGASGFVGLPTLAALAASGAEVHAISTRASPPHVEGVRWHHCDLGDGPALERMMQALAPEQLVHLAWYVEHGRFWSAPENLLWVERSLRLLRAFTLNGGRRALLLGTCAEYDWSAVEEPLREYGSPLAPASLYGVAKDALRRVASAYAVTADLELAWGRLFFMYGPREPRGRLVPAVITSLLAGAPVETTSGVQRRDFMHVADVAAALVAVLMSDVVGPVNIASGDDVAVAEVVERIAIEIGRPELLRRGALPDRADEPLLLSADTNRLRREVGFLPGISLERGIAETVAWWRETGAAAPA